MTFISRLAAHFPRAGHFATEFTINAISMYLGVGCITGYMTYGLLRQEPPRDPNGAPVYPMLSRREALSVAIATGAHWPDRLPLLGAAQFEYRNLTEFHKFARQHDLTRDQAITIMATTPRRLLVGDRGKQRDMPPPQQ